MWKPPARLGMSLVYCFSPFLVSIIISAGLSNVYLLMYFKTFLPMGLAGFIIFGIADFARFPALLLGADFVNISIQLLKVGQRDVRELVNASDPSDEEDHTGQTKLIGPNE